MNLLAGIIEDSTADILNPDYQANMYLIDSAMRMLGKTDPPAFQPSQYDDAIMELIDSVPTE